MIEKIRRNWRYVRTRLLSRLIAISIFYLLYPFLYAIPIKKNKIVVSNFNGKGYGDNAKYICNYLIETNAPVEIVWLIDKNWVEGNGGCPEAVKTVSARSFRALFELYTAKIWIDNCRKSFYPPKRKYQFYIQTWHAGFSLKQIERNVEAKLTKQYVKCAKKDSKMCDLLLFESSDMVENVSYTFWYEGEIFRNGLPRNDLLINYDQAIIDKVYTHFNIKPYKKIVMYAPTFRQEYDLEIEQGFLEEVLQTFNKSFSDDFVLLVRLHPNDTKNKQKILGNKLSDGFIDGSSYDDMQELLCAIDTLITDYSSSMGEMMITEKKCFLYAYDYEEYIKDRGLLMDLTELPFPFSLNKQDLLRQIKFFSEENYISNLRAFKTIHNIYETGKASEEIGNLIIKEMNLSYYL
ncbi:CDP-ribitol:poly(ribitol phosphate) ribitol phosphotransferase [Enterococcus faecalis FL2]|uniref:CDP-glycerol glycerophosphotransferase family protein n=1 Tax=Enterococcus TaxID=1350 RepID=UPI00045A0BB5|nr:CDP-glycerol glycerophosphotransferase family protein [Enterococcus faecalis]EHS2295442.1 CDP-glycerol glycerophosphotransferase family protein [Enterococcus faecalis]KAJ60712.1 CDP-ribitol:poly(ribitol phosphate) ribitol phosphotransferase [Enterococcus faecalis FL2]